MKKTLDPRTKIIISFCLSSAGVFIQSLIILAGATAAGMLMALCFGADLIKTFKKLKKLLVFLLGVILLQSLFIKEGNTLIGFSGVRVLTDIGFFRGIGFGLRFVIILLCGVIMGTSDEQEMIEGLSRWHLPYELIFMTKLGIRFVPIFAEEFKDTLVAIQLRGIDMKELSWKSRFELYSYILTPVAVRTLKKAQHMALSAESRGFGARESRTSLITLAPSAQDYLVSVFSIMITLGVFVLSTTVWRGY